MVNTNGGSNECRGGRKKNARTKERQNKRKKKKEREKERKEVSVALTKRTGDSTQLGRNEMLTEFVAFYSQVLNFHYCCFEPENSCF